MSDEQVVAVMAAILTAADRVAGQIYRANPRNAGDDWETSTHGECVYEARNLLMIARHIPSMEISR